MHFRGQRVPNISPDHSLVISNGGSPAPKDDGLGRYHDGVERTLTDDQVKMFRHSEIQRLLSERRQARQEAEEAQEQAERREEERARKRKFYDDVAKQQDDVQDLSYDDPPEQDENTKQERKFLWPRLGV